MEEIWIRDDGTVTQKGDPLGRRFVPTSSGLAASETPLPAASPAT